MGPLVPWACVFFRECSRIAGADNVLKNIITFRTSPKSHCNPCPFVGNIVCFPLLMIYMAGYPVGETSKRKLRAVSKYTEQTFKAGRYLRYNSNARNNVLSVWEATGTDKWQDDAVVE